MKTLKILKERVYKAGFILRTELIESPTKGEPPFKWTMAYTPNGGYLGKLKSALYLCGKLGIVPEMNKTDHNVCSIGFSHKDGKWYGWSHRAIYGFKIGSTCKKGDCHYIPKMHYGKGAWTAKTVADARRMACDFASGVS